MRSCKLSIWSIILGNIYFCMKFFNVLRVLFVLGKDGLISSLARGSLSDLLSFVAFACPVQQMLKRARKQTHLKNKVDLSSGHRRFFGCGPGLVCTSCAARHSNILFSTNPERKDGADLKGKPVAKLICAVG